MIDLQDPLLQSHWFSCCHSFLSFSVNSPCPKKHQIGNRNNILWLCKHFSTTSIGCRYSPGCCCEFVRARNACLVCKKIVTKKIVVVTNFFDRQSVFLGSKRAKSRRTCQFSGFYQFTSLSFIFRRWRLSLPFRDGI